VINPDSKQFPLRYEEVELAQLRANSRLPLLEKLRMVEEMGETADLFAQAKRVSEPIISSAYASRSRSDLEKPAS
jgi:hypothetical protein